MKKEIKKNAHGVAYCRCKKPKKEVTTMKGPLLVYCGKCRRPIDI